MDSRGHKDSGTELLKKGKLPAALEAFAEEVLTNPEASKKLESIARDRLQRSARVLDDFGPMTPSLV